VEEAVGVGSMGEVFRVRHVDRGTVHALKYLALPARKVRQRLLREAEVQTRLSHPNVVTLTEVIEIEGDPGLVMEYVDGPSLAAWLETHKPSAQEAEALFRGIVAGVAHAHRRGLVHRDLKPANVLLARTAQGLVPKVADFGIAKVLESTSPRAGDTSGLTRTGMSLGSPPYMAPEQIRDARSVDRTADIWSLGAILYELVLHRRAFDGNDVLAVLNAAQAASYPPPRTIKADLPERFVRVIEGCLKADPEARFESAEDVVAALEDGGAATAVAVERLQAQGSGVRRFEAPTEGRREPWSSTTLVVVGVLGAVVAMLAMVGLVVAFL